MQDLANRSEGFTGADLAALVQEAALAALTDSLQATVVQQEHFNQAFQASFQNSVMTLSSALVSFQCLCNWRSYMILDAPSVKPALQRTCLPLPLTGCNIDFFSHATHAFCMQDLAKQSLLCS